MVWISSVIVPRLVELGLRTPRGEKIDVYLCFFVLFFFCFNTRGASVARVLAVMCLSVCVCVCLCVCYTPVLYQNG